MKIAEVEYHTGCLFGTYLFPKVENEGPSCFFMLKYMRKHFDLPANPSAFWTTAHSRPANDRVAVEVRECTEDQAIELRIGHGKWMYCPLWDDVLRPFAGKTLFVQVHYEV